MNSAIEKLDTINSKRTFASCCALGLAGVFIFSILPLLIGTITTTLALTPLQSGTIISTYYAGYSIVAITSFIWFNRVGWRKTVRYGYLLAIVSVISTLYFDQYDGVIIAMLFLGFSGALFFSVSMGIIAKTDKVEQNYAFKMVPEQLVPSLFVVLIPMFVIDNYGLSGLNWAIIITYLLLSIASYWVPENKIQQEKINFRGLFKSKLALWALFGLLISFAGFLGLWGFIEIIAIKNGIEQSDSSILIALSLIASAVAPFISGLVGEKFGRIKPIAISLLFMVLTFGILFLDITLYSLGAFIVLIILFFFFALPYAFAAIAKADITGELAVLSSAALAIGSMMGSFIFGAIMEYASLNLAFGFSFITIVTGSIITIFVEKSNVAATS
ncbi:MFS transporter [Colwelliaceae bacterium BS250]